MVRLLRERMSHSRTVLSWDPVMTCPQSTQLRTLLIQHASLTEDEMHSSPIQFINLTYSSACNDTQHMKSCHASQGQNAGTVNQES